MIASFSSSKSNLARFLRLQDDIAALALENVHCYGKAAFHEANAAVRFTSFHLFFHDTRSDCNQMGWCRGEYYQRSHRRGGQVVTEYVGGGFLGALAAILDREDRDEREEQREAARETLAAELAALEAERSRGRRFRPGVCCGRVLGYARYARNPWKRRRTMKPIEPPEGMTPRQARADICKAIEAARTGDQTAMNKVREFGRSFPAIVADEAMGNIAEWAMSGVIGG